MASTRSKNCQGDYKAEQQLNTHIVEYDTYVPYGTPAQTHFAGDGLLNGKMYSAHLSTNACDVESMLRGIGSTNLVAPNAEVQPNIKSLNSLHIIDRLPVYLPEDLVIRENQRPLRN